MENKEKQKEKKFQNCEDLSRKIDKQNRDIDKEKEKAQSRLHNMRVEKERKETELKADISLLNHRLEGLQKQLSIQESELSALERRLEVKKQLAIYLEEKTTNMTKRVSELQDEVLSWKLSSCREDEGASSRAVSRTEKESGGKDKDHDESHSEVGVAIPDESSSREVEEETPQDSGRLKEKSKRTENKNTPKSNKSTNSSQKKKVRVIGTSNIKFISPSLPRRL